MAPASPAEYIGHHIQNLTYGKLADGHWGFAETAKEATAMGFLSINADTMAWSLFTGVLFCWLFRRVAATVSIDKPSRFQLCIEMVISLV